MLNVIVEFFNTREDIKTQYEFPALGTSALLTLDLTNSVLDEGINLTKRMEYDSFESIGFDTLEITFSKTSAVNTLLRQIERGFIAYITITYSNVRLFAGFIDKTKFIEDKIQETITIYAESILRNLIEFWDNIPLPFYNFDNPTDKRPAIVTTRFRNRDYENIFEKALIEYQGSQPRFFQNQILTRLPNLFLFTPNLPPTPDAPNSYLNFYFQNNIDNQEASYYRLQQFSYRHFNIDNVHYDRFSTKDFLIECAKFYGFSITLDKTNRIRFVNKVEPLSQPYVAIVDLDDKIIDDYTIEYDYKSKYEGVILNTYSQLYDGWLVYYKGTTERYAYLYQARIYDTSVENEKNALLDMRLNLYSNLKSNNAARYTRGYTPNAVVFHNYLNFIWGDFAFLILEATIRDYLEKLLKISKLVRVRVTGFDYQVGDYYKIENQNYVLIEQKLNFNDETSELILREV